MFKTALQFKETDGTTISCPRCVDHSSALLPGVPPVHACSGLRRRVRATGTGIDAAGALSIMIEDLKQLLSAMPSAVAVDAACGTTKTLATDKVTANGAAPA